MKSIPPVIYGTAWKKERTAELVEKAILNGFKGIDTACQPKHYYEPGVGQALQNLKKQGVDTSSLYLQTKFTPLPGQDPSRLPYNPTAPLAMQIKQSFETSLQNLQVDFINGLLLHSPLSNHKQTMEAWSTIEEIHQEGKVEYLGISNCYSFEEFKAIFNEAKIKPSILQNRFYADTQYDKSLRQFCNENNVTYQAFWTLTANPQLLVHPTIRQLASNHQVTEAQLFFSFLIHIDIIPLIGTCSEKHMQDDLAALKLSLSQSEIAQIEHLLN
jgi:diketogulonate reductase-like aldo/keto reductase